MATNGRDEVTNWVGWVYFAGILMILAGIFQAIAGLTALLNDKFYVVSADRLVAFDYTTWGWIHLVLGGVLLAAGSAVMNGRPWGRIIGVTLAAVSTIANFLFLSSYPVWSVIAIIINIVVIYALVVHGDEARE